MHNKNKTLSSSLDVTSIRSFLNILPEFFYAYKQIQYYIISVTENHIVRIIQL